MNARISSPANVPALPILAFPGVEESNLGVRPEGLWTTATERRPREVEYIAVFDQHQQRPKSRVLPLRLPPGNAINSRPQRRRRDTKMGKLIGRLFVGFTIILISFNGYSSQLFIIWPWYGKELSVDLLKLLIPFKYVCYTLPVCTYFYSERGRSVLLGMLWWNYYLSIFTDPGRVPPQWVHTTLPCCEQESSLNSSIFLGT